MIGGEIKAVRVYGFDISALRLRKQVPVKSMVIAVIFSRQG